MSFPDLFGGALASFGFAMAFVLVLMLGLMIGVAIREVAMMIGNAVAARRNRRDR